MERAILLVTVALVMAALPAVAVGPALGAPNAPPPVDPGTTVYEAGGSNMGECSAYLGTRQVRDDVNRLILAGAIPGIENPGQIYSVRARQDESLPPEQECLQRTVGG